MASLNKVMVMGNLTRDPELRYTPNGTAVANFTVAVSRTFNAATGEKKEETSFVRVVCWTKLAEVCSKYLTKGRPVFVEGRLQSRSWQEADGKKRNTLEVVAQNVQFMGKAPEGSNAGGSVEADAAPVDELPADIKQDEEVPF